MAVYSMSVCPCVCVDTQVRMFDRGLLEHSALTEAVDPGSSEYSSCDAVGHISYSDARCVQRIHRANPLKTDPSRLLDCSQTVYSNGIYNKHYSEVRVPLALADWKDATHRLHRGEHYWINWSTVNYIFS